MPATRGIKKMTAAIELHGAAFIYSIADPRDGLVRYIGLTKNPQQRDKQHRQASLKSPMGKWMIDMANNGVEPIFTVMASTAADMCANQDERRLIAEFRANGHPLLNGTHGKRGRFGKHYPSALRPTQTATQS